MRCRTAKWSPLNSLLIVAAILFSTSAAAFVDPKNSDSENQSSRQQNYSNSTSTLVSDPRNQIRFKRRWSNTYGTSRVEPRLFFPTFATPRPPPNYGLHFKGYNQPKAPIGYPVARPPLPSYSPQPNRPAQPSHTYGVPKPTGYPASSNYHHHNHQEVYFTYPPATSVGYPQTTSTPVGSYGSGYPSGYQSTPPPNKPNYEVTLPTPNPSYYVTTKPIHYVTTPSTPYPSPKPTYPVPIGPTNYPGYPASNGGGSYNPPPSSGYPSPGPVVAPSKPINYPVHSSSSYPSYPASSGGSYPISSSAGASHLPIFVFIPKPGYFHGDHNSKPGNYHKPTGTSPPHYYPATNPPVVTQYYPPAKPVKPVKPVGVYPSAKPPSTAYGLPKPQQRPTQPYYPSSQSGSYGTENVRPSYPNNSPTGTSNQVSNYKSNEDLRPPTRKPFDVENHLSAEYRPNSQQTAQAQPSVFQRGNIFPRPVNSLQPAISSDFISLPDTIQLESAVGGNQNQSWTIGAASSQVVSVTEHPRAAFNNLVPSYQDEFRIPFQSNYPKPPVNDCGGSWVVLQQPTGGFADPTQVQIEPIRPQFENSHRFHFKSNDQLFRSPSEVGVSVEHFSSGINEPFVPESISNTNEPYTPDFLIFSTTPNPELVSTTEEVVDPGEWRKPNSLTSSFSFNPRESIPSVDRAISSSGQFSSGITVIRPDDTTIPALTSTENSIILSLNAINLSDPQNVIDLVTSEIKSPSPFLVDISSSDESDENDSKEAKSVSLTSGNNVVPRETSSTIEEEDSDRLSRHLRSANLRVISSLISQAGIASLFQDKDYTLLAPSNAAFNKISAIQRQRWATRPDLLREMLLHHVIPNHFNSSSFENEATPTTLAGAHRLRINIYNATENRETITTVNGARVLTADLRLGKLLVHVIDRVLLPGNFPPQTILDILNDGGLQASLLGPALTKVLSSDSPLSVFVPTTEAFLSVSQDEQRLFLNNETAFHNLLWYHIVPGTYYSEGLEDGQLLSTLHDVGRLRVDLRRQNRKSKLARINGVANVIESDVSASNGVVHFIDRILTDILF
ncbi:uncharacterized protein LOC124329003 isoform X2 [Daphnia pulicaria]|uniref:uncharacterized protein LOC124329003 isoform X2 n=1 Tax=Daphnia pulicaria TaxID=35523 RepID=UPI001EEB06C5|nr:uncharacterized protein LOC124329003 isoform X2 [Daphnia pulicaria]